MKMRMQLVFSVLLVFVAVSCSKDPVNAPEIQQAENIRALEQELLQLVNDHRNSMGASPLAFSEVAYSYANTHTDYMISREVLNHDNFSARASQITETVNAKAVAENVARDYSSAQEALQGWLQSESHRKTMEGDFTHTAVSVKAAPNGSLYFTQLFVLQ
jgi:uncharacterized protein YkwD